MLNIELSKLIGLERFFAGQALPLASRALLAVAALAVVPGIHAATPLTLDILSRDTTSYP